MNFAQETQFPTAGGPLEFLAGISPLDSPFSNAPWSFTPIDQNSFTRLQHKTKNKNERFHSQQNPENGSLPVHYKKLVYPLSGKKCCYDVSRQWGGWVKAFQHRMKSTGSVGLFVHLYASLKKGLTGAGNPALSQLGVNMGFIQFCWRWLLGCTVGL